MSRSRLETALEERIRRAQDILAQDLIRHPPEDYAGVMKIVGINAGLAQALDIAGEIFGE